MSIFKDIGWGIILEFRSIRDFLCYVIEYSLVKYDYKHKIDSVCNEIRESRKSNRQ